MERKHAQTERESDKNKKQQEEEQPRKHLHSRCASIQHSLSHSFLVLFPEINELAKLKTVLD